MPNSGFIPAWLATLATQHQTTEWWGWAMYKPFSSYWTNAPRPDAPDTTREFKFQHEHWGDPKEFGYKNLITFHHAFSA